MFEVDNEVYRSRSALMNKWNTIMNAYGIDQSLSEADKTVILEMASYRYGYKEFIDAGVTDVKVLALRGKRVIGMFNAEATCVYLRPETIIRRVKTVEENELEARSS